jgi:hypothetical protein
MKSSTKKLCAISQARKTYTQPQRFGMLSYLLDLARKYGHREVREFVLLRSPVASVRSLGLMPFGNQSV